MYIHNMHRHEHTHTDYIYLEISEFLAFVLYQNFA